MRPFRLLLSLFTCFIALTLLLYARFPDDAPDPPAAASPPPQKGKLRALFSWTAPSSLFPPSAVISLTDDNSTYFVARPAAFGPSLPHSGLSGPLWVGSGFADDSLAHAGFIALLEGELGCSDVPGWNDGNGKPKSAGRPPLGLDRRRASAQSTGISAAKSLESRARLDQDPAPIDHDMDVPTRLDENDGTDDYLHLPLGSLDSTGGFSSHRTSEHADIQSLQEGAEIAGKIVLLSRGGCGFLEKTKWVQRRGGTALIVGDNIRGGPLITMYARGDTSNITIPSLFTSHTTAHLLSSLMPSGGFVGGIIPSGQSKSKSSSKSSASRPTSANANSKSSASRPKGQNSNSASQPAKDGEESAGWFRLFLSLFGFGGSKSVSSRPPSSGDLDWVLGEDAVDGKPKKHKSGKASDGFVIGVQDWRDPDLLPQQTAIPQNQLTDAKPKLETSKGPGKGGSILPSSGEYATPDGDGSSNSIDGDGNGDGDDHENHGWLSSLRWGRRAEHAGVHKPRARVMDGQDDDGDDLDPVPDVPEHHDGLWVTLTPTSMSASPFFDTLLVLVVSPLVTLTVVYALLLLRSRIRRRRWRAPKSVVERLPVRTYHTLPSDSSSPASTPATSSPTTPLLSHHAPRRNASSRSRPRSRTTPEIPAQGSSNPELNRRSPSPDTEKREAGLAEWRRRYGGRQKECVVCLEEYVDGVSRVMSLPCGHEFHAECITPWLTTRRRTCPICKGDVVRSLQRGSSSNQAHSSTSSSATSVPNSDLGLGLGLEHRDDDAEDAIQDVAVLGRNEDPDAPLPIAEEDEENDGDDYDIERADARRTRGASGDPTIVSALEAGWARLSGLVNEVRQSAGSRRARQRDTEVFDRNR